MIKEDFSQRSTEAELMDTETVSFAEFHQCLRTLEVINILTLAYRPTMRWFKRMLIGTDFRQPISVLDIGCGGGDMLRQIWKLAKGRKLNLALVGIDLNPWSKQSAEQVTSQNAPIRFETENLFSLDVDRRADFIISSLFTHHLSKSELIRFIRWMDHHATRGWFINDLHRHFLPYFFIKYATRLFFSNRLIKHDAPVSVARAFTAPEWRQYLSEAGIPAERTSIEWFFPFRFGVACRKA
jgi:2-polyprenyl-3-methyl-5-hydroxy-6-metoxy-1,4-benzoquinol methylase